jgi:hypothetical protein
MSLDGEVQGVVVLGESRDERISRSAAQAKIRAPDSHRSQLCRIRAPPNKGIKLTNGAPATRAVPSAGNARC